jgi:sec-independent protein translocase protein TatA
MIPNIGPLEIAIVLGICLLIFGPRRLPDLGRSAGRTISEFRASLSGSGPDDARKTSEDSAREGTDIPARTGAEA